jgi:hypothetical protein
MNNYRDFENFLQAVDENNRSYIQTEIADMIITLDGEQKKIIEAVLYARANSSFEYDKHSVTDTAREADTIQDAFYTEKSELNFNFSEERLLKTIALYQRMKKVEEEQQHRVTEVSSSWSKKSGGRISKEIIVAGGILFGGLIIYALIKYYNESGN